MSEHAYPQSIQAGDKAIATGGMTKREEFASRALQGIVQIVGPGPSQIEINLAVDDAYAYADAMIRKSEGGPE